MKELTLKKKSIDYSRLPLMLPNPGLTVRMLGVRHLHMEKFWASRLCFFAITGALH